MSYITDTFGRPIFLPIPTPITQVITQRDEARERELEARIKRLEDVLLSRHGGEPLDLMEEVDAWRGYANKLEGFVEQADISSKSLARFNEIRKERPVSHE